MASYIVKAKGVNLENTSQKHYSAARFYSGDRFYTLINEYIDKNLTRKNWLLGFIIKILFRSSNYKHDPQIANGRQWSVFLFDFICCTMFIVFIGLIFSILVSGIVTTFNYFEEKFNNPELAVPTITVWTFISKIIIDNWQTILGMGVGVIITGIVGILWLVMIVKVRKKNKSLSLQAYVEKKISICLSLRFLIKLSNKRKTNNDIILLENFEAQGAAAPRWSNIQMINLVSSIFNDFSFIFRFDELSDAEYAELIDVMDYDFNKVEMIKADNIKFDKFKHVEDNPFKKKQQEKKAAKTAEVNTKEEDKTKETKK